MEMASSFALRPSLPLRINSRPSRCPIAAPASSLSVVPPRNFRFQPNRSRETLLSSFVIKAMNDMTVAPSSCAERLSSKITGSENMTVCEEYLEDEEAVEHGDSGPGNTDDAQMVRVCDKLIDVFMVDKPTTTDWRRLLASSKEWCNIRAHFYKCCQERADRESDQVLKHKLLRLGRKLKEVDDDVQRHNELVEVIKEAQDEISSVVGRRRKDFTKEFFEHLHTVIESYYDDPEKQNDLARLGTLCLDAVQTYDDLSQGTEALDAAELKFNDIINSPTLDAACRKIDILAEKKELDSALMLMITKAWSTAKESSVMKDEVKDILYHLYMTAMGNFQCLMPKESEILRYLLTIKDPEEQICTLKDAFTPGDEGLYTTPEALYDWISKVVDAYHFSREGTLIKEARDLMNPQIIQRVEDLKKVIENNFL